MYLGLDLGTSALKALLIDDDQRIIGSASAELDVLRPASGWSEQKPQDWIEACEKALEALKADHGQALAAVDGIGLSGEMHSATLLDKSSEPLRPCVLWNDTRAHREAAAMGAETLTAELGDSLRLPSNTTFLPYLSGERTPHHHAAIRGTFAGLGRMDERPALTQAILEGVAFALRDNLEALGAADTKLERIMAVSGGSKSPYWLSALATTLGLPHGVDFGAARLGLIAATSADPTAVCAAPVVARSFEPEADLRDAFDDTYSHYRALDPAVSGAMT